MNGRTVVYAVLVFAGALAWGRAAEPDELTEMKDMLLIAGGTFEMGDVFNEGVRFATPVHEVTVSDFYLNGYEVTVAEFSAFVKASSYVTSAERETGDPSAGKDEYNAMLASSGAHVFDPAAGRMSWVAEANWKNPQYEQSPRDPVACVSWVDAVRYCNWLSAKEGLPVAYDVETGDLLDAEGRPTADVTKVRGYRLPTEAEWEYAAREHGKKIRFGNGQDIAKFSEMNFNAAKGEFAFAEKGEFRKKTVPVGSFEPNALGLHDMAGNVWEWCSDFLGNYPKGPQTNPYQQKGMMGPRRVARDGPWAGDASWARTSARMGWVADDRCNMIGFRLAKSK
jgi:formylglycine-generating enzyme required for sulfatase activity